MAQTWDNIITWAGIASGMKLKRVLEGLIPTYQRIGLLKFIFMTHSPIHPHSSQTISIHGMLTIHTHTCHIHLIKNTK